MPINHDAVGAKSEPTESRWTSKDCLLYALGVGAGQMDPTGSELEFTTENSQDVAQRVLPTFAVVASMYSGGGVLSAIGPFDHAMLVHGEQAVEVHQPLPVEGHISTVSEIVGIYDKGSGAVVATEARATDVATGRSMFTTTSSLFIRGEGGWGGDRGPSARGNPPDGDPDHVVSYATRSDQALLYRLSGDRNPLHSDPKFAARAGFEKPILHGLCTYGFTGRALLHTLCGSDPDRFVSMSGRFSRPVMPGDTLTVSMWQDGRGQAVFRTNTQRGDVVIDGGRVAYRA